MLTPALHFVDDIETDDLAPSSSESVQELGKHLAARFKERKAKPPAPQHQLLGVTLRLEESRAVIECTAAARQRMDTLLLQILLEDKLTPREASALAGKLQFISRSLFGKSSAAAIKPFHARAQALHFPAQERDWHLGPALKMSIAFLRHCFANARPRAVEYHVASRSIIYADAFFELGGYRYKVSGLCKWLGSRGAGEQLRVLCSWVCTSLVCSTLLPPPCVHPHGGSPRTDSPVVGSS